MLPDLAALLAQSIAQIIGTHALRLHTVGQEGHHQRCQHGHQLTGIAAQTRSLTQLRLSLLALTTKNIAQNGAAIELRAACTAAQHRAQNTAQTTGCACAACAASTAQQATQQTAEVHRALRAAVVTLQCTQQIGSALRLSRVLAQCAKQHGQRHANSLLRLHGVQSQLLGQALHGRALQLAHQFVAQRCIGGHKNSSKTASMVNAGMALKCEQCCASILPACDGR